VSPLEVGYKYASIILLGAAMKKHMQVWGLTTFVLTLFAMLPVASQADVTVVRLTHFDEVTGIASHDSTTTDYIQGDRKREENLRKFTGAVLGAWQRFRHEDNGALSIDIYNVGDNKHYELDPNKKTYSEEPLYQPPKPVEHGDSGNNARDRQQRQQDSDTKVTKNEFTVKATGKKKKINGFDTNEYLVTWDLETENTKTGEKGKSLMTTDLWNSTDPKLVRAHAEENAYDRAYLKLMRVPYNSTEIQQYGFGTMHVNGEDQKKFLDKLHTIKGFPVSSDVTWQTASTDASGKAESDNKDQQPHETVDSAIGSLFGARSKHDDSKKTNSDGMTTIFSSHVEIKSVDTGALGKSLFVVPKDYKTD
jgi:hypothetical protein